jgi:hypothetical protein
MSPRPWFTGFRRALAAAWLLAIAFGTSARADDRLTGYWVAAADRPDPAVFAIGQLGKWTLITQRWGGPGDAGSEIKVRYLATTEGDHGVLTADQNLDKLPGAPKTIAYQIQGGRLTLTVSDAAHAGTYELIKGTPPSPPAAPVAAEVKKPAPRPAPPVKQDFPWAKLLGSWSADPQSGTQINLFLAPARVVGVFKVNQRWIHGTESPAISQSGSYTASMQGNQAVLTKDKPDFEGSPIPLVLLFNFEGDNLYVTVNDGPYAGRYQLVHQARNQKNPG